MYLGPFPKVTLEQELEDAQRELNLRENQVYPHLVNIGKLDRKKAEHQIACQRGIVARLKALLPQQLGLGL